MDDKQEVDHILHLIDCLHKEIQHNTTLVWQGVSRSLMTVGVAITVCTFVIRDIKDASIFSLAACAIIASLSMIGHRLLIFSITRNIEHVHQYNNAINRLEEILKEHFKESEWAKYLLNNVYNVVLGGTDAGKHNKQVSRTFPWTFYFLSCFGVFLFVMLLCNKVFSEIGIPCSNTLWKYLPSIPIGVLFCIGIQWLTPKLQAWVAEKYKDETGKWDRKFQEIVNTSTSGERQDNKKEE